MKGDFTRFTFRPEHHYNGVRMQQGRVQLDTDFNEYVDIQAHLNHTVAKDVIGPCGAPQADGGFEINVDDDNNLTISPGRFYVNGILCQAEEALTYSSQPDYPNPVPALEGGEPVAAGTYLAYLDVWQRLITVLEDASVREVALGGPDTTTRTKTIWQVKLLRVGEEGDDTLNCLSDFGAWQDVTEPSSGLMSARAEPEDPSVNPCIVPASAGYRGLENQLYRVEVHEVTFDEEVPDTVASMTIKWSRENGSVTTAWEGQDNLEPTRLTVANTGRDEVLGFAPNHWIELTDDERELKEESGILVRIQHVNGTVLTIDSVVNFDDDFDSDRNPKVRRWDMSDETGAILIELSDLGESWIGLENGIEVRFEPGTYRPGDYWVIPARTATGDIEWPRDEADEQPIPQPPHGITHHYCHLALLNFDGDNWSVIDDCRPLFPPLTELTRFFYVGGDGQEARPGNELPQLLQAGVMNGQQPEAGRIVRFTALDGGARVAESLEAVGASATNTIDVTTDADGIASCAWQLLGDVTRPSQQLTATLLDAANNPSSSIPITFTANLSLAREVAYESGACAELAEAETVQQALDILCNLERGGCCIPVGDGGRFATLAEAIGSLPDQGQRDICICLLPGNHVLAGLDLESPSIELEFHLKITGCGQGSRVFLEAPMRFRGLRAITLDSVAFELRFPAEGEQGAIAFDRCHEVTITSCHISGITALEAQGEPGGALVSISNADRVTLRDNVIEAALPASLEPIRDIFAQTGASPLPELFNLPQQGSVEFQLFRIQAQQVAQQLVGQSLAERGQLVQVIGAALADFNEVLSRTERFYFQVLMSELVNDELTIEGLYNTLLDIRRTAIKSRPGVAMILGSELNTASFEGFEFITIDQDDSITLENNDIIGIVSLYGMPPSIGFIRGLLTSNIRGQLEQRLGEGDGLRNSGLLGTLQLRGNQFVRITVGRQIVQQLRLFAEGSVWPFGLFNRCFIHDNVVESADSVVMCVHQTMNGNDFAMSTLQDQNRSAEIAMVVANSAIYMGNHSGSVDWVVRDFSVSNSRVGNLNITIA